MKKNNSAKKIYLLVPKQLWLQMKITTILLILTIFCLQANDSYSQNVKVSLDIQNATITEIFREIENRTDYRFFYNKTLLNTEKRVSVNSNEKEVSAILDQLLAGENVSYTMVNNYIVITPKENEETNSPGVTQDNRKTVIGTVTDESGEPIIGANIIEKGTTNGTVTDIDGKFNITVSTGSVLLFSYIGYKNVEIPVGDQTIINIQLQEDTETLEEVVVVGYGTQKRVNLTGSVSSVNFDKQSLQSRAVTNVSSLLSGASSGIRIQQTNGLPSGNEAANINIRGVGSLNISSAPLVVVDGQVSSMNSVSPNDVASVSVLKDAASAAIYGSRASNGVILITTKTGSNTGGKVSFSFDTYFGKKTPTNVPDVIHNTVEYMELQNRIWLNSGSNPRWTQEQIDQYRKGHAEDPFLWPYTNQLEDVTKENIVQKYHLSARGGSDKIKFYSALEYYKDNGLIYNTGYKRLNFRNNLDYQVNKWLKLGNSFSYINGIAEPSSVTTIFQWMRNTTPAMFTRHPDGRWGGGAFPDGTGGQNNPRQNAEQARGESINNQLQGKIFAEITPLEGLKITGSYFRNLILNESWSGHQPADRWNFRTNEVIWDMTTGSLLNLGNSNSRTQVEIIDLYANYVKSFRNHNIDGLIGFNQEYNFARSMSASKSGLLSYDTPVLDAAQLNPVASGTMSDYAMRSFFGRLSYNYLGKYMLEANVRYDGSSRFSPDNRWGFFPSVSAGWYVSEESFWEPLSDVIDALKIRASWGKLGNAGIGNYEWQHFYSSVSYARENKDVFPGLRYNSFGNTSISWETTQVTNIGADFRLFNKFNFDFNYYIKNTSDILTTPPIPAVLGGIGAPRVNLAGVQNKGLEIEASYNDQFGDLSFNVGLNYSFNKNKISKYQGDLIDIRGTTAWTENYPIGIFYVLEVDQIVQDKSLIDKMVADGYKFHTSTPGEGDFLYKDTDGNKSIDMNDRVLKGNPIPVHIYGGSISLGYAGLDFNAFFSGVAKWDRYLNDDIYNFYHIDQYQLPYEQMNMWSEDNRNTKIPKIYTNNHINNQTHDAYIRKADYLKIRSLQLGYSLPQNLINRISLTNMRVYLNAENPFTFTSWPSYDPEADGGGNHHTYPLTRTISMGLNISF